MVLDSQKMAHRPRRVEAASHVTTVFKPASLSKSATSLPVCYLIDLRTEKGERCRLGERIGHLGESCEIMGIIGGFWGTHARSFGSNRPVVHNIYYWWSSFLDFVLRDNPSVEVFNYLAMRLSHLQDFK